MKKPIITLQRVCLASVPLGLMYLYTRIYHGEGSGDILQQPGVILSDMQDAITSQLYTPITGGITLHDETFVPDVILRVTEEARTLSCINKANVVVVNGSIPGPEVRLIEGQTSWIRVFNDMADQNLTMHWHGLSMAVSPFSDGTPQASQWPIPPKHFFDYELRAEVGMAGTYFYHSHIGFQAITAAGPLTVQDVEPVPYHYDEERIIALSDIFNKTDVDIESGLLANPFVWSGETMNVLVNGKGQLAGSTSSPNCGLASIDVQPGKTYRLRFIGGTALSFVTLAFEDHDELIIIEADGSYTQPVNTAYIQIGSGQRFSVLLRTKNKRQLTKKQYYMQIETRERPTLTTSYAILNYGPSGAKLPSLPETPPLSLPPTTLGWLDYQLQPLTPDDDFPSLSEVTRTVTIRTHQLIDGTIVWAQDQIPWTETFPQEPYLVSLYKDDGVEFPSYERAITNGGIDPQTRAFPANIGEVIDIIIQNTGSDNGGVDVHPFHAHGSHYWDLGSGNGTFDQLENDQIWARTGGQPAKRDTTMLYRYGEKTTPGLDMGWRAWRLRATEPGVWLIHCHILQHMIMGMQTLWVMGNESEILTVPLPDVTGYMTYGGSVYGNETWAPSTVHFKDSLTL